VAHQTSQNAAATGIFSTTIIQTNVQATGRWYPPPAGANRGACRGDLDRIGA
jgi:hypothetical protein